MIMRSIYLLLALVLITACSDDLSEDALIAKYTNEHSRFVTLNDWTKVHYRKEGNGPVIILLHGTASSLHTWDAWTRELTNRYQVIRPDLPGFGLTGPQPQNLYEVADDVRFLRRFADALDLDRFHLAGSSLGGRIAWQYSLAHEDQVMSLTLLNALGYPQEQWPPAIEMAQWPVIDTLFTIAAPRFLYASGLKDVYADPALLTPDLIDRYYHLAHYPSNMSAFPIRVKARLDKDAEQIKQVTAPTLVLWGQKDKFFPVARAHDFGRDIPGSRVITYAAAGHLPMEEVPKQSAADFMAFLSTLPEGQ